MSLQAISSHQNVCYFSSFNSKNSLIKTQHSNEKKLFFSLIDMSKSMQKLHNNENFPKEKWWKCVNPNCGRYNLKSVWRCAYCGTARP